MDVIPHLIIDEENKTIDKLPNSEEVKTMVFKLNGDSIVGPYGYFELYFQKCWDIVGEDVVKIVKVFFFVDNNFQDLLLIQT